MSNECHYVFYHPSSVEVVGDDPTKIRPRLVRDAMKRMYGDRFIDLSGDAGTRKAALLAFYQWARACPGEIAVLGENLTLPLAFVEPDHLPRAWLADVRFFLFCRRHQIPVRLFYRDTYLFHPFDYSQPRWVFCIKKIMNYIDVGLYSLCCDRLLLPHVGMKEVFPGFFKKRIQFGEFPPGTELLQVSSGGGNVLRCLYVGGLGGGHYNLDPMLDAVVKFDGVALIVVCREREYENSKYANRYFKNVEFVHAGRDRISELYAKADLFLDVRASSEYMKNTIPYKLYEVVSHGVPILVDGDSCKADVVNAFGLGRSVGVGELDLVIAEIIDQPDLLQAWKRSVLDFRSDNTWELRIERIMNGGRAG